MINNNCFDRSEGVEVRFQPSFPENPPSQGWGTTVLAVVNAIACILFYIPANLYFAFLLAFRSKSELEEAEEIAEEVRRSRVPSDETARAIERFQDQKRQRHIQVLLSSEYPEK